MNKLRLKGFSLIELLVALAILSIIAAYSAGQIRGAQQRNRDVKRKADLNLLSQALDAYYAEQRTYPGLTSDPICPEYKSTNTEPWIPGLENYISSSQGGAKKLPKDPQNNVLHYYSYQCLTDPGKTYQLFVTLEHTQDSDSTLDRFGNPSGQYRIDR